MASSFTPLTHFSRLTLLAALLLGISSWQAAAADIEHPSEPGSVSHETGPMEPQPPEGDELQEGENLPGSLGTVQESKGPRDEAEEDEVAQQPPLEVHFIKVGQGDSALIRSPGGKTVLIDAGGPGAGPFVADYLEQIGVNHLELAVASHPHLDHLGGMLEVLRRIPPKAYMDPGFPHPLPQYSELLDWLEKEEIPVRLARGGRNIVIEEGVVLEILAPTEPFHQGSRSDVNSNSVVSRLRYKAHTFLFTGDAENVTERRLLKQSREALQATVLQVAHHGSRYSSSASWLKAVSPEVAVISLGKNNSYGHPHPALLKRLESQKIRIYRSDEHGDVIARSDGNRLWWEITGENSAKLDEPGGISSMSGRAIPAPVELGLINLNTADRNELMKVPGIGAGIARRILDHRERHGRFRSVSALLEVGGIGEATLRRIEPYLTVASEASDE